MAAYKLPCLAASAAILLALGAPAPAQTVEHSTCSFGWVDRNQTKAGWVCSRITNPPPAQPAPPATSGSSTPQPSTIQETPSGVTILRGGG